MKKYLLFISCFLLLSTLISKENDSYQINNKIELTVPKLCLKDILNEIDQDYCFKRVIHKSQVILLDDIKTFIKANIPNKNVNMLSTYNNQIILHLKLLTKKLEKHLWEKSLQESINSLQFITTLDFQNYNLTPLLNTKIPLDSHVQLEIKPLEEELEVNIYTSDKKNNYFFFKKVSLNKKHTQKMIQHTIPQHKNYTLVYEKQTNALGSIKVSIPVHSWGKVSIGDEIIAITKKDNKQYKAKVINENQAQIME